MKQLLLVIVSVLLISGCKAPPIPKSKVKPTRLSKEVPTTFKTPVVTWNMCQPCSPSIRCKIYQSFDLVNWTNIVTTFCTDGTNYFPVTDTSNVFYKVSIFDIRYPTNEVWATTKSCD